MEEEITEHIVIDEQSPTEENFAAEIPTAENSSEPSAPRRRGGPSTPAGKKVSSMNRFLHGCRSEKTLLHHEDPAEFNAVARRWFDHYQPDEFEADMVADLVRHYWVFQRNRLRLEDCESNLPPRPWDWNKDDHHRLSLFLRYKTTAERSYIRSFTQVEAYYGRRFREGLATQRALAQAAKFQLKWLDKQESAAAEALKITQRVEIEVTEDGQSTATYVPTNRQLIERVRHREVKPLFFTRYLVFPNGVPESYTWTNASPSHRCTPVHAIQKLLWSDWISLIEHERVHRDGHPGPLLVSD